MKKASRRRRWRTGVPKNYLTRIRIQASFILKGEGVKSWLQPDLGGGVGGREGGDVLTSSLLQPFTGGSDQDFL